MGVLTWKRRASASLTEKENVRRAYLVPKRHLTNRNFLHPHPPPRLDGASIRTRASPSSAACSLHATLAGTWGLTGGAPAWLGLS